VSELRYHCQASETDPLKVIALTTMHEQMKRLNTQMERLTICRENLVALLHFIAASCVEFALDQAGTRNHLLWYNLVPCV